MSEQIIPKRCSKCKQFKSLSEYGKDRRNKDSLQGCCKSCVKADQQSEKGKAANRKATAKYRRTPNGKIANRKTVAKYYRTPNGKAAMKRYKACHPNLAKAYNAVNHAIKAGKLPRADTLQCHYCFRDAQQYHHWKGYEPEHWLDVVPACVECHTKEHRKIA